MATIIIGGVEQEIKEFEQTREYIDLISITKTIATDAVNTYTEHFSNIDPSQKVQIKWATGLPATTVSATVSFMQEGDKYRAVAKVGGSIMGGIASTTITSALIAFAAGLGTTLGAPVIMGVGVVGGVVLSTAGGEAFANIYDAVKEWFDINDSEDQFTIGDDKNIVINTPFNLSTEEKTQLLQEISKHNEIQTINLNNQTYILSQLSNSQIKDLFSHISETSFLLSDILIRQGEILELGNGKTYEVKLGDTLSQIAQANGLSTKDLVGLNTWLIDDDRIKFLDDKAMVLLGDDLDDLPPILELLGIPLNEDFRSPLVLDLNNDGITSLNLNQSSVYFDLDNNNFKEQTAWISQQDGLLVYDKNNNGIIDNGNELFGNNTILNDGTLAKDGFNALSEFDTNQDEIISNLDDKFDELKVWIDENQDGISQSNELKSLNELGIQSINLNANELNLIDFNSGNKISHSSSFVINGNEQKIDDVWFMVNSNQTAYDNQSLDFSELNLKGSGNVKNLQDATSENEKLNEFVHLIQDKNYTKFSELLKDSKELLYIWSGADSIDPNITRGVQNILSHNQSNPQIIKEHRIYAYEKDTFLAEAFMGKKIIMTVDGKETNEIIGIQASNAINNYIDKFTNLVAFNILAQKLYKDEIVFNQGWVSSAWAILKINNEFTSNDNEKIKNATNLLSALIYTKGLNVLNTINQIYLKNDFIKQILNNNDIFYDFNDNGSIYGSTSQSVILSDKGGNFTAPNDKIIYGGAGDDKIYGTNKDDIIYGGNGDDYIVGANGNDELHGGYGNDTLIADWSKNSDGYGHDILYGDEGDDILIGSARNSSYYYSYGDGDDVIKDGGGDKDALIFENINSNQVKFSQKDKFDLFIQIYDENNNPSGSVLIKNYFSYGEIEIIEFSDISLNQNQIMRLIDNCDDNIIHGLFNSNNIFYGNKGNDTLYGYRGDDTYIFNLGDGNDTIIDYDYYSKNDTIKFGSGISKDDLIVSRVNDYGTNKMTSPDSLKHLLIKFKNSPNDSILIKYAFENNQTSNRGVIENFIFVNGDKLSFQNIKNLCLKNNDEAITGFYDQENEIVANQKDNMIYCCGNSGNTVFAGDGDDTINGSGVADTIYGENGDDKIFAYQGNDTLIGGKGNDNLCGHLGDDIYIFNKGDGLDTISEFEGNDTIKFGSNLSADDIKFSQISNDLLIKYGSNDQITIKNYFLGRTRSGDYIVENFSLEDGSILTSDQINKIIQDFYALNTQNNSEFDGFSFSEIQNQSNLQIYG